MSGPRPDSPDFRPGLTLIEVLVVLAISALLFFGLVWITHEPREAARRSQCINNLKQIGMALHNYADVWGGFPAASSPYPVAPSPGYVTTTFNPAPHVALLPHIEAQAAYNALNFQVPMADALDLTRANATVASTRLSTYVCPSDSMIPETRGLSSYRANLGPCAVCPDEGQGALIRDAVTPIDSFLDGLSQTMAFAERSVGSTGIENYDPRRDWLDTHATAPMSADDWRRLCSGGISPQRASFNLGQTWLIAGGMQTHVFTALTPNAPVPDCGSSAREGGYGAVSARSEHPGGVNVLMADGSVRFVPSDITLQVWRAQGTRAATGSTPDQQY